MGTTVDVTIPVDSETARALDNPLWGVTPRH
jgi:hypothetical protein